MKLRNRLLWFSIEISAKTTDLDIWTPAWGS